MKIKKGDQILIIAGKDRLRKGKVINVLKDTGKLMVEGINIAKKHRRPRREGEKGQIVETPMPLDVSNAKLICPQCAKACRVGVQVTADGRKLRQCKKCQATFN